jgi:hypothetical protein
MAANNYQGASGLPDYVKLFCPGYSCQRKALINSDVEIISERSLKSMTNVNTPEEYDLVRKI